MTEKKYTLEELIEIIKILRSKNGCPWDREQTHESLKKCLIEEAYEVIEAIDKNDKNNLEEELGDLLLQIVFHSNIAEEEKLFNMEDVITRVSSKMVSRHPHVFGNKKADDVEEALLTWEEMKKEEKGNKTQTEIMRDIPKVFPALTRSYKVQKKAAEVGFDWDDITGALDKVEEEKIEIEEIMNENDETRIKEEVGDLLFAVVNVARFLKVDPEEALNNTTEKFMNRFQYVEESAVSKNVRINDMELAEMDELWEKAKKVLKNK